MKSLACCLSLLATLPLAAQTASTNPPERLGTVSFQISCAPAVQAPFNRGVALLHDFWYQEAGSQFKQIAAADPTCAVAYWGQAMSVFQQIWNRPDEATMAKAWTYLQQAAAPAANKPITQREHEYIAALTTFFQPGPQLYFARIEAYSQAMATLYAHYPEDTDAGAFYALSLLAAEAPEDTTLAQEKKALAVLDPLFLKTPDHPGVAHYIIHACDTPSLAQHGLAAAERYGDIAPSAPHAVHMPGHIFARLGMWQPDIGVNLKSVAASQHAAANHQSGAFDQLHADDFLVYAYLQSGQEARAKGVIDSTAAMLAHMEAMPDMPGMSGMAPYFRSKFAIFYDLELQDWQAAAALRPIAGGRPQTRMLTYWARTLGAGHLHQARQAKDDLAAFDALLVELRKGKQAYFADSTSAQILHSEIEAWSAFAEGKQEDALTRIRAAADLQDKVGQGEVDIPAREMLGDMLLELHQPRQALAAYDAALKLSPNRFNGLYHAGLAAEAAGDKAAAATYYAALLKSTNNGSQSGRPELAHVKTFTSTQSAANSPTPPAQALRVIRVSNGVIAGRITRLVQPIYPDTQESGIVTLAVRLTTDGLVKEATAIAGPDSLRPAAVEAVRQWQYQPYLLNGQAIEVQSQVNVQFSR